MLYLSQYLTGTILLVILSLIALFFWLGAYANNYPKLLKLFRASSMILLCITFLVIHQEFNVNAHLNVLDYEQASNEIATPSTKLNFLVIIISKSIEILKALI
jgi:hypothetical protein